MVAARTGVAPSALRYYEKLGLLEPADRTGLRRTYDPDAIDRVALIVNARATGFTLAEVHDLLASEPASVRARLVDKIAEIDHQIEAMTAVRHRLDEALTCQHASLLDCPTFRAGLLHHLDQ